MVKKKILQKLAKAQSAFVIGVFYFLIGLPIFVLMKLFRYDPLSIRSKDESYWHPRKRNEQKTDNYLSQF